MTYIITLGPSNVCNISILVKHGIYLLIADIVLRICMYNKTYRRRNSEMRSWQVHESRRSVDSINSSTKVTRLKSSNVLTFLFSTRFFWALALYEMTWNHWSLINNVALTARLSTIADKNYEMKFSIITSRFSPYTGSVVRKALEEQSRRFDWQCDRWWYPSLLFHVDEKLTTMSFDREPHRRNATSRANLMSGALLVTASC